MKEYDVIIIGGGPGGYASCVSACNAGLKTALIEREYVGGVCVNWGCIPTKALIRYAKLHQQNTDTANAPISYEQANGESLKIAQERREHIRKLLLDSQGELFNGTAKLVGRNEVLIASSGETIRGRNIIIATGSSPRHLAIAEYGDSIVTTREALQFKHAPKSVVVIGTGATGIELASVWCRFGAKVTVLEMLPVIMGLADETLSEKACDYYRQEGIDVCTSVTVESIKHVSNGAEVIYSGAGKSHMLYAEKVLVAAGVVPNSSDLGLEALGIDVQRGYIQVDDQMRTNVPGIYAVGDVTGKLALAFTASKQGKSAVAAIVGKPADRIRYMDIPRCIFSSIESASVGLNEQQAVERGFSVDVIRGSMPSYDGHNVACRQSDYKLIINRADHSVLGITMLGMDAAEKIAGAARLMVLGAPASELANTLDSGR